MRVPFFFARAESPSVWAVVFFPHFLAVVPVVVGASDSNPAIYQQLKRLDSCQGKKSYRMPERNRVE